MSQLLLALISGAIRVVDEFVALHQCQPCRQQIGSPERVGVGPVALGVLVRAAERDVVDVHGPAAFGLHGLREDGGRNALEAEPSDRLCR